MSKLIQRTGAPEALPFDRQFSGVVSASNLYPLSLFDGGVGVEWTQAQPTVTDDAVNVILSSKALKLEAASGGTSAARKTVVADLSLYDSIRVQFYVPDGAKLNIVALYFGDTALANYYSSSLQGDIFNTGWNVVSLKKSYFSATNAPNWASIQKIQVLIIA